MSIVSTLAGEVRHRAYRLAYEIEVFNAAPRIPPDRLAAADSGELMSWFREAWSERDFGESARIGEILWARGRLRPGDVYRLRRALTLLVRAAEQGQRASQPIHIARPQPSSGP